MNQACLREWMGEDLSKLVRAVLTAWPDHEKFLMKTFSTRSADEREDSNIIATHILQVLGEKLETACEDYQWLCGQFSEERLHFAREGKYRFSRAADVASSVYGDPDYMGKYMSGLLISQVLWVNHLKAAGYLRRRFFPTRKQRFNHLEVGPGHGLYVFFAARTPGVGTVSAWDISPTSIERTLGCLDRLGLSSRVQLHLKDATADFDDGIVYDSIVLSEVLEHVERPRELLRSLRQRLSKDGCIFINVPVNSPAPDHIYLLDSPEAAVELVQSASLTTLETAFFPETGLTLDQARKKKATITCIIVARNSPAAAQETPV